MLKNILPIGSFGSSTVSPSDSRIPRAANESPIARASGTDRGADRALGRRACRPRERRRALARDRGVCGSVLSFRDRGTRDHR